MRNIRSDFAERVAEVDAFMVLVSGVDASIQARVPLVKASDGTATVVEPLHQQLLFASVYLQLYNLVEATVCSCVSAVEEAASAGKKWRVDDLSRELRSEWVKSVARTHEILNTEHRLEAAVRLCDHLVELLPVAMKIRQGGGGNWDDAEIDKFAKRLGVVIQLKPATITKVKRHYRDHMGAIATIKMLRNKLAHGEMSFSDCGSGHSVQQLEDLKALTVEYLGEVVDAFDQYLQRFEYLQTAKRPGAGGS